MKKNTLILMITLLAIVAITMVGFAYFQPNANAATSNNNPASDPTSVSTTSIDATVEGHAMSTSNPSQPDQNSPLGSTPNTNNTGTPATPSSSKAPLPPLEAGDLLTMSGKIIAEGNNTTPQGALQLKSYRVEEINIEPAAEVTINGQTRVVNKAWKVSITGGPFTARDARAMLWSNDQLLGYASESPNLDAISAITIDPKQLTQGQTLSLSYDVAATKRQSIPEKLDVSIKP